MCLEHIVECLEHQVEEDEVIIAISTPLLNSGDLSESGLSEWYCAWISRVPLLQVFDVLEVRANNEGDAAADRY